MNLRRFTPVPVEDLDRAELRRWADGMGLASARDVLMRTRQRVGGRVSSIRITSRATWPALEVTIDDGQATVTGVFSGRTAIAALLPGAWVEMDGVVVRRDGRLEMLNPAYTLR